jgi:PBP1b-binding outer membrane lipoprotein LpoB
MRKFPAFLMLLAIAAFWTGCANSNDNTSSVSNVGTTTYNKADASSGAPSTTSAPSGGGASNTAAPKGTPPTRIKPPT